MDLQPIVKTTNQINSDAESFLETYYPAKNIPIPIEKIIDLQLQIDIIPIPGLKDVFEKAGLDIDAFIAPDFKSISVDMHIQEKVTTRYRFTLAHEIGHMVLHSYLYKQFQFNTMDQWIEIINNMPISESRIVEWQADEFAGLVLVPREFLKEKFVKAIKDTEEILNKIYRARTDIMIDLSISSLAKEFVVSDDVIRIRLQRDGLLDHLYS